MDVSTLIPGGVEIIQSFQCQTMEISKRKIIAQRSSLKMKCFFSVHAKLFSRPQLIVVYFTCACFSVNMNKYSFALPLNLLLRTRAGFMFAEAKLISSFSFVCEYSNAVEKRLKEVTHQLLVEEAVLRRSSRVHAHPKDSPSTSFLEYVNTWKPIQKRNRSKEDRAT
uniref:Uncharacterized protein n=1 Tax=Aegilops tauschii subsp. strangulata TaxID=200361 RepID=A0A453C151_AEGTS